jgi:uncharacterized membrane protein
MKGTVSVLLITLLICLIGIPSAFTEAKFDKNTTFAEKIKDDLTKMGAGKNVRVEVKLHDKTFLKGYVKEIRSDSFLLADEHRSITTKVDYPQIKRFKAYNLSTGQKIAVGLGVSLGILLLIWVLISTSD